VLLEGTFATTGEKVNQLKLLWRPSPLVSRLFLWVIERAYADRVLSVFEALCL